MGLGGEGVILKKKNNSHWPLVNSVIENVYGYCLVVFGNWGLAVMLQRNLQHIYLVCSIADQ